MSTDGVLDFQVVTGSVTGDVFKQFVQHLMPFKSIQRSGHGQCVHPSC